MFSQNEAAIYSYPMLVEDQNVRSIARIEEVSKNTIAKMIVDVGRACAEYQDRIVVVLSDKQDDERIPKPNTGNVVRA